MSEGNSRESLTSQQRNLLLAEPVARLSLDRRVIFKDDPTIADRLDVQYLELSAIDFVMERSAVESGASPDEFVEHVAAEATRVKPSLTDEQSRKVGQVVLDYLANARDGHKAFRIEYCDADRGGYSFHDFRLLALSVAADGSARFKLARGNLDDLIVRTSAVGAFYVGDLDPAGIDILLGVNERRRADRRTTVQPHRGLYRWLLAHGCRRPLDKAPRDGLTARLGEVFSAGTAGALGELWAEGLRIPQESFGLEQLRGREAAIASPESA